jgi:Fe-S-cluster-containing hydrogenase component 2
MGHMVGKDVYRKLGKKIDGLSARVPWNETLHAILRQLYTPEEADLIVRMPYRPADIDELERFTKVDRKQLESRLQNLAEKGLILDVWVAGRFRYVISPLIIGIFEFTMMRTRGELDHKAWAALFHEYLSDPETYYRANLSKGQSVTPLRALPHEGTIDADEFVEVLDYEKATKIVANAKRCAIGICSCRHEKLHIGEKKCDIELKTCSSFDASADYLIRHGFAEEVDKSAMLDRLAQSREEGLVFCADNVKRNVSFICHCCGCCCNVLLGISKHGYPNLLVSSNYIAASNPDLCTECHDCVEACPIQAVDVNQDESISIDEKQCVGCGVCALACDSDAMRLVPRPQRVFHPEDTYQRVILQHLDQGNLQNLLFSDPQSMTHQALRAVVGAFFRLPPVKKVLMGDRLRSRFLKALGSTA